MIVTTKNQINITLAQKPLGSGGEGGVFKIISPQHYSNKCVKIYNGFENPNPSNRTIIQNKEGKIQFMIDNPPSKINEGVWMLTWPEELVYDSKGSFLGYMMPLANPNEQNEQLFNLLGHDLHPSIKTNANKNAIWSKFSKDNVDFIKNRLMVCSNIAKAFHFLHITNKYVVVDLKPENILVSEKGKIAVCDLDSIQISNNNLVLYHAGVITPNYAPPESKYLTPVSNSFITVEWDKFSLASVCYDFIFGINPFSGLNFQPPYDKKNVVPDRIESGLFINGSNAKDHLVNQNNYGIIYLQHNLFNKIDYKIQQLFLKALDEGCFNPNLRPNAEQWGLAFSNYVHVLQQNPIDFRNYLIVPKSSINSTQATNTYKTNTVTQKTVTPYTPTPTIQQPQIPPYTQKSNFDSRYILLVGGLLFIFFILFVTKYKKQTVEPATEYATEVTTEVATEAVSTNNYTPTTTETTVQPTTETENNNNTNTTSTYYENDYYLNKIKNFYVYEKNRDFNALYNNYLQNLNRYYDLNTPTYSSLEKRFNHLWEITSDVSNNLKSYELNRFDNHVQLIITLDYTYFGIKTQEYKTINDIKVVFNFDNNGNMMGIYDMK